jgi:hypothetical protein
MGGLAADNFLLEFRAIFFLVRNNLLAVARKFSRPCLAVLPAGKTSLRLTIMKKICSSADPFSLWCPGEDLNLHALRHMHLKHTCLPITPPGQVCAHYTTASSFASSTTGVVSAASASITATASASSGVMVSSLFRLSMRAFRSWRRTAFAAFSRMK